MSEEDKNKLLWWVVGAVVGSVGLNQGIQKGFPDMRSDPFTGAQGNRLHIELTDLEHRVDDIDKEQWRMISRMIRVETVGEKCTQMIQEHLRVPHHFSFSEQ